MTGPNFKRRRAFYRGVRAEKNVRDHLTSLGFDLLEHRYKTKYGEIDLIMRRSDLVIFVEVKARPSIDEGAYSVTPYAQKRISDSALIWIAENATSPTENIDYRFDVAIVTPDNAVTIVEAAFDAGQ